MAEEKVEEVEEVEEESLDIFTGPLKVIERSWASMWDLDWMTSMSFSMASTDVPNMSACSLDEPDNVLGQGGSCKVVRGELREGNGPAIPVALKLCTLRSDDATVALLNEINVFNNLADGHPNVIKCYGGNVGDKEAFPKGRLQYIDMGGHHNFLAEELMKRNLADLLHDDEEYRRNCTYKDFIELFLGIVAGLQFLHEHKIVHYDLKPGNVLLDENNVPKIADFGGSRIRLRHSLTLHIGGTIGYMAPEITDSRSILRGRARTVTDGIDIFSLGVMMWEALTGLKRTLHDTLRIATNSCHDLSVLSLPVSADCPQDLQDLVSDCLRYSGNKSKCERPSCEEIEKRLRKASRQAWVVDKVRFVDVRPAHDVDNLPRGLTIRKSVSKGAHCDIQEGIFVLPHEESFEVLVRYPVKNELSELFQKEAELFQMMPKNMHLVEFFDPTMENSSVENSKEIVKCPPVVVVERMDCDLNTFLLMRNSERHFIRDYLLYDRTLCKIWRGIASGLMHLHKLNVIYMNLNPETVLLNIDIVREDVKAVKLGSLLFAERLQSDSEFRTSVVRNKGYMAGEVSKGLLIEEVPVNDKVDVFSLGVLIWRCIYQDFDPQEAIHISLEYADKEQYIPEVLRLVENCTHTDPSKRPSMKGIIDDLDHILDNVLLVEVKGEPEMEDDEWIMCNSVPEETVV